MNIVNTLTLRHIKAHKKRSILTVFAIIVSVAMVTAVFTSAESFINFFRNVSKSIDGTWHASVLSGSYIEYKDAFQKDFIEKTGISIWFGDARIRETDDDYKMCIDAVDENFLTLKNVKVSEGRMPSTPQELLVQKKFVKRNKLDWHLGDKILLPTNTGEEVVNVAYQIVGFTDSNVYATDVTDAFSYATEDFIGKAGEVSVIIQYKKLDKSVYDKTNAINEEIREDDHAINYNYSLLTYSGIATEDITLYVLIAFCAIILLVITCVSILMIYDSFAVSYQERARYLGMLASVGATKKQKRNSIYFEGLILGLIGIPIGIIAGIGGIWITFKAISDVWMKTLAVEYDGVLSVHVNWIVITGTVLASALTIFISGYIPARKASKTTAIDAIKQVNNITKKKSKALKSSRSANKLLGYEGVLAVKNFKRNGRRSATIVFALSMSVIMFLSVANFSLMFTDVMTQSFSQNADITVSTPYQDAAKLEKAIAQTNGIKEVFFIDYEYAEFDKSLINPEVSTLYTNANVILAFVDNATLDSYLKQLGEKPEKYHDLNNPTGILHNTVVTRDGNKKIKVQPFIDIAGQKLETNLKVFNSGAGSVTEAIPVNPLVGIQTTKDYKNDYFYYQDMHLPLMMLSIDMAPQYFEKSKILQTEYLAQIISDDPEAVESDLTEFTLTDAGIKHYTVLNATSEMNSINNILTIAKVFIFGLITLITLISVMNIINTISNSMNERRREFAMIRSVGLTPGSFKKMIYYENFRYGLVSLLWSVPVSILIHFVMYSVLSRSYDYGFQLHLPVYLIAVAAVFIVIGAALLYSIGKIKDDNIIETLKADIN